MNYLSRADLERSPDPSAEMALANNRAHFIDSAIAATPQHTPIDVLVPYYTANPAPMSKARAVHVIVEGRLNSHNARGHGNAATRRIELLRSQFEAECDAATDEWYQERELTEADVDALAEEHAAGRHFGARSVNFHD